MAIVKVSWSIDAKVVEAVKAAAEGEQRSVSQMASLLLETQLWARQNQRVDGTRLTERIVPSAAVGGGEPRGDVPATPGDAFQHVASGSGGESGSSPPPTAVGSSAIRALGERLQPPRGESCPRWLDHKKGVFCKACGEMQ